MKRFNLIFKTIMSSARPSRFIYLLAIPSVLVLSSCDKNDDNNSNNGSVSDIKPKGTAPAWGTDITPQMLTVVEKIEQLNDTIPLHFLTTDQARITPSAADAATAVQIDFKIQTPAAKSDTAGIEIPVTGGATVHARIFTPRTGKSSYPVILYFHGGGFVIATIDTYKSSAQALAEKTDAIVVSVEYRKGPEFKFPTAHNDAYDAYAWLLTHANTFKGDTAKVALAGESAGGNLAAATSLAAVQKGIKKPLYQVLVYPIANNDTTTASMTQYAVAVPLGRSEVTWFTDRYLNSPADGNDPRISLVDAANLSVMPPTLIIAAELDPLQTEGMQLYNNLKAAGINAEYMKYTGVTHEFFGMNTVIPEAQQAEDLAASKLKDALK